MWLQAAEQWAMLLPIFPRPLKEFSDSASTTFRLLVDDTWAPTTDELPPVITPHGLSSDRQWYLYNHIREFCRASTEDLVCPIPSSMMNTGQQMKRLMKLRLHHLSVQGRVGIAVLQDTHEQPAQKQRAKVRGFHAHATVENVASLATHDAHVHLN